MKPDHVFGLAAREFLPSIMPGLLGIFLAVLLASVMSSCDSFMIASSGLFTENIYKPLRPGRRAGHYMWVARVASLGVVTGGVAFAYWLPNVVEGLKILWKIAPMMGIAFWLGLFWRKTTVLGAWASTLTAFGALLLSTQDCFIRFANGLPLAERLRFVVEKGVAPETHLAIYLPWQMVFYLTVGLVVGIVVSLLSKPVSEDKLEKFYALVRTPVKPDEEIPAPCTLPEGTEVPPQAESPPADQESGDPGSPRGVDSRLPGGLGRGRCDHPDFLPDCRRELSLPRP